MKRCFPFVLLGAVFVIPLATLAAGVPRSAGSVEVEIESSSAYLFDARENHILFDKNADRKNSLASLTKLMTALLIYEEHPAWGKGVEFKASDRKQGNIAHILPGEEVTMEDLWNLMLIASSNDAVASLVRSLGFSESEFTARMNAKAHALGLMRLNFSEPTGLDAANVGTAREVAALARVVFSIPKIRKTLLQTSYSFAPKGKDRRTVRATNALLLSFLNQDPYRAIAGKTGFIAESKYNLVFASARGERDLIGVILGSPTSEDRFQSMKGLLYWGFEQGKETVAKK